MLVERRTFPRRHRKVGAKSRRTHIIGANSAGQVVVRRSPMTVGPICVQISYNLTEILKEMFACYLQYRCVITLSTRLTSDLGSVFCPRGAIRLPAIDMSRKGLTPRACMGDGGSI